MARNRTSLLSCVFLAIPIIALGQSDLRKARVGDPMEPFTLRDMQGAQFTYRAKPDRPSIILFAVARQELSERVMVELKEIVAQLGTEGHSLDLVAVISGRNGKEYFQAKRQELNLNFPLLLDEDFQLWGKLGVIASPTVLVVDKRGRISWIRAGHGYDFKKATRFGLLQALELMRRSDVEEPMAVETLLYNTALGRARSHLKMARLLAGKGQMDAALEEAGKAEDLEPLSSEVLIERGLLLCRAGKSEEALELAEKIKSTRSIEKARVKLISGWAHRQLGHDSQARELLLESVGLEPRSVQAYYELGKVYRKMGQLEKAAEAYERALSLHFMEAPPLKLRKDANGSKKNPHGDATNRPSADR